MKKRTKPIKYCAVAGCNAVYCAKGYCAKHYARYRKHGDPNIVLPTRKPGPRSTCLGDGCERLAEARGYCNKHYERYRKYGDPNALRNTKNTARDEIIIALRKEGKTYREIGEIYNISRQRVQIICKRQENNLNDG